jgi:drug/metabolite transporter (DMT)-like permease
LLYLIVFGSIFGFTAYGYLLRHVPPVKASTYAFVNPVVAVLLGMAILSETIDARTIIAMVVILGGVGIVQLATVRRTKDSNISHK